MSARPNEPSEFSADSLTQAVLDAMDRSVALLTSAGTIVAVNRAWRSFADENDLRFSDHGVGQNYISICESARGPQAEAARNTATALRDISAGRLDEWTCEYPCHGPGRTSWFRMRAVRIEHHSASLMVAHKDITSTAQHERDARIRFTDLTSRELDVLKLLVVGLSSKQVAAQLFISVRTVENHRRSLMRKTGTPNVAALIRLVAIGNVVPLYVDDSLHPDAAD